MTKSAPVISPDIWPILRQWACDKALPLWANAGFDPVRGAFIERLRLDGTSLPALPRRLTVQARQVYVYSEAARLQWMPGSADLAQRAADSMIRDYAAGSGADGWAFSVGPDGQMVDATRDLYAQAFALFGLASVYQLTQDPRYLACADKTLAFLDARMAAPAGGYVTALPDNGLLLQNPHMHLLEACLALHEQDPNRGYGDRATRLVQMFQSSFFQKDTGILVEKFGPGWAPLPGDAGRFFEPGHHYEWIWLLDRYDRLIGGSTASVRAALAQTAQKWGANESGLLHAEVRDDGTVLNPAARTWPYTEAIKAALADPASCGGRVAADRWLSTLYTRFFMPAHPGGWIDRFDAQGRPTDDFMPASTFYHVMVALSEYARHAGKPA